jgi:hypothetical protein
MNRSIAIASILSIAAFAAQAESPNPAGQYGVSVTSTPAVAAVQGVAPQHRVVGNPWSTQYNPLANFQSQRTRADVQADFIASRDRVAAFTSEDSGSAYLKAHRGADASRVFAGPATAQ